MWYRNTLLGIAMLAALSGKVFANTGVFAGSGHSLQLIKSADVQMVSEEVTITPTCGVLAMMGSVDFRCVFVLKNLSAKAVTIQVGFPLDFDSHGVPRPPSDGTDEVLSYHFIVRDADNTYHVRNVTGWPSDYPQIFLWDMTFRAGETKTLHVGYIIPVSFAGSTTRKPDDLPVSIAGKLNDAEKFLFHDPLNPPEYEKPWHARVEACEVVYFSYITGDSGKSWPGRSKKATFRVRNHIFEYGLRKFPEFVGAIYPADLPASVEIPEEATMGGSIFGMKLGTLYSQISPEGWKSAYIPEIPPGEPKPGYEPDGIAWKFEN